MIVSVTYREDGRRTLTVDCQRCSCGHDIDWPAGVRQFELICGTTVVVPSWCFGLRSYGNHKVKVGG